MAKETKCCVCGCILGEGEVLEYKRKKYCYKCFEESYDEETVSKHYCYLTFQRIFGRKPNDMEWSQMNRMVAKNSESESVWNWRKLEYALEYVYEIEQVQVQEEYGVIGILPYYEAKMMKFRNECFDVMDDIDEFGFGMADEETVVIKPRKENYEHKIKHIDIDWSDEDCQDE